MELGHRRNLRPQHRLTEAQFLSILDGVKDSPRNWMICYVSGNTGLRISEVMHLRVSDFDPSSGVRVVRRKRKTLESEALDVADEVFEVVSEYVRRAGLAPSDWLFPGDSNPCKRNVSVPTGKKNPDGTKICRREVQSVCDGAHLTVRRAQQIWDRALGRLGLKVKGRGIHTLRHYDGTRYYEKTRDLRATQIRLGHSSPMTTQIYADVVELRAKANQAGTSGTAMPWSGAPEKKKRP